MYAESLRHILGDMNVEDARVVVEISGVHYTVLSAKDEGRRMVLTLGGEETESESDPVGEK